MFVSVGTDDAESGVDMGRTDVVRVADMMTAD